MNYAWRLAGDAIADLRELDPWLQEDVLDELEQLSANPFGLRVDPAGFAAHDFERGTAGFSRIVFLRLHRDDTRRVLSVLGIAESPRPSSSSPHE